MSSVFQPFGEINFLELLKDCKGIVEFTLIDAGMIRPFKQEYEFRVDTEQENIFVKPAGVRGSTGMTIPILLPLYPENLIFFGMYDGDGNKTGDIGFAQNNTQLQTFVAKETEKLFPNCFPARVNILEDSKYFDSEQSRALLASLSEEYSSTLGVTLSDIELQKEFLRREFASKGMEVGPVQRIDVTISSKKGSQSAGKRSYEIIVNKVGSRYYRPLLLYVIKKTIESILGISSNPGIIWHLNPSDGAFQSIDAERFVSSNRCQYVTKSGGVKCYTLTGRDDNYIEIRKPPRGSIIKVSERISITPLLCLMFGIYWAEGTTTKEKIFSFGESYAENLGLGFNSSEDISLQVFFRAVSQIFPDPNQVISNWLVKIGAKYHAETTAVASKLGVPVARGGPGGDGVARTIEITKVAKLWALEQFPSLHDWEDLFSHIEFTGMGIPRVDIRCKSPASEFLFSLMRDLSFYENQLSPFIV